MSTFPKLKFTFSSRMRGIRLTEILKFRCNFKKFVKINRIIIPSAILLSYPSHVTYIDGTARNYILFGAVNFDNRNAVNIRCRC